jgi:hypothetical protein
MDMPQSEVQLWKVNVDSKKKKWGCGESSARKMMISLFCPSKLPSIARFQLASPRFDAADAEALHALLHAFFLHGLLVGLLLETVRTSTIIS